MGISLSPSKASVLLSPQHRDESWDQGSQSLVCRDTASFSFNMCTESRQLVTRAAARPVTSAGFSAAVLLCGLEMTVPHVAMGTTQGDRCAVVDIVGWAVISKVLQGDLSTASSSVTFPEVVNLKHSRLTCIIVEAPFTCDSARCGQCHMVQTSLVKIRDGSFKFMLLVLYVETGLLKSSDQFGHIDLRLRPPVHVSAAAAASHGELRAPTGEAGQRSGSPRALSVNRSDVQLCTTPAVPAAASFRNECV